jgi:hypothetical protein
VLEPFDVRVLGEQVVEDRVREEDAGVVELAHVDLQGGLAGGFLGDDGFLLDDIDQLVVAVIAGLV